MNQPIQISNGWVAAMIAALIFDILYPLALGIFVRRSLGVSCAWRSQPWQMLAVMTAVTAASTHMSIDESATAETAAEAFMRVGHIGSQPR